MTFSERVYRRLLHLYPREFREEYGQEMALLFRDRAADTKFTLWLQVVGDLLFHAPREHWSMAREDVKHAWRTWRRAPAAAGLALSALTIGMGANVALFSLVYAVLIRPLPVHQPERLLLVAERNMARGIDATAVSLPNYQSWRSGVRSVELAAFSGQTVTWTGPEYPERLEALAPTASFLAVAGARLQKGRWFTAEEELRGHHTVAVLSDRLWRTRFGADAGIVGRHLLLNATPYTVVGVADSSFTVPSEPDLWVPQVVDQAGSARRGNRYLTVIGRLRAGFTIEDVRGELATVAERLAQEFPDSNRDYGVNVSQLSTSLVTPEVRTALIVLFAASLLVVLIACANVANILLVRAVARGKEIAIRAALGAGLSRIARQLLTESVLLSVTGAVLALALSAMILAAARRVLVDVVPRVHNVGIDVPVLVFAGTLGVVTGIVFGLAPLWRIARPRQAGVPLSGRDDWTPERARLRAGLIVGQVALTTVLLVGAGLLVQSLLNLGSVPVGFNPRSVLTAKLSLTRSRLPDGTAISAFLARLTSELQRRPGVTAVGISSAIPISPGAHTMTQVAGETGAFVTGEWRLVDAGYFQTLQIPLLRGRLFARQDRSSASRVFVISEHLARTLYGDEDPVGRRLRLENGSEGEVIGVVGDVRMKSLGEPPERVVYFPPAQFGYFPLFNVVVRTAGNAESAAATVRDQLKQLDPMLAAYQIRSMQYWIDDNAALMRIRTGLVLLLGVVALAMGVIGIYGVIGCLVEERAREFGIRIALGASLWALPLAVVRGAGGLVAAGILIGLAMWLLLGQQVRTLLFQVDPLDATTFALVVASVLLVGVIAAYMPARRAAAVDPLVALRTE